MEGLIKGAMEEDESVEFTDSLPEGEALSYIQPCYIQAS